MNSMRVVALMACVSRSARPFTKIMATAFAPSARVGTAPRRHASSPFCSPAFSCETSSHQITCAHRCPMTSLSFSFTQLHSTIPNNNDATVTENYNTIEEVDPYSDQAKDDLEKFFKHNGIDVADIETAHDSLLRLTEQVLSWNQKLNLVSRKDCTASVIYHRHVLPSVALLPLILETQTSNKNENATFNIVDVGTGGGFPGLPLALLLPEVRFTLVDSVQKKLRAVGEMAAELDMGNVRVHWGRVEEMYVGEKGQREHFGAYDVVLGRSVTALPRFCGWVSDLLTRGDDDGGGQGRLIYIIGGELDEIVESRIVEDMPLDHILRRAEGTSDKRALVFRAGDVEEIATESGEKKRIVRSGPVKKKSQNKKGGRKMAKGAWNKKRNDVKKQRGYDDFQRYEF